MSLSNTQSIIIVLAVTLGTMVTRFTPFILFPESRTPPPIIGYLSRVLPAAMMGLLVVYCLKSVSIATFPFGLPEAIACLVIAILHKWKNNVLLSIASGTAVYMVLVNLIFI